MGSAQKWPRNRKSETGQKIQLHSLAYKLAWSKFPRRRGVSSQTYLCASTHQSGANLKRERRTLILSLSKRSKRHSYPSRIPSSATALEIRHRPCTELIPFIQMWKKGIRLWPPRPVTGTIGAHVRRDLCPPAHTGGLFFTLDNCRARPTNPVRRGASLNARPATMEACGRNPAGGPASALPPKADMCSATRDVRFGPIADMRSVGAQSEFDDDQNGFQVACGVNLR